MKKNILVLGLVGILVLGIGFEVLAEEQSVKGKEELLFEEIPIVFAASKRLQPITEAASNIEVITAEEIKQSGAVSIADVLRKVVGVQVREPSASSHAIGVRGFTDAQHVLITVDGNSAYLHHVNHTYVDLIPVDLEEIERIEIVKGPGAVFYGGSAFSGVINIVTKTPKQISGTQVNMAGGDWDIMRGNIIHGGNHNRWDYGVSAGHYGTKYLSPPRALFMHEYTNTNYGAVRSVYHLDDDSSISIDIRHRYTDDGISRHCTDITNTYVTLRYDQPNFWVRLFQNRQFKYALSSSVNVDDTNNEFEIMRVLEWQKNITSIGGFAKRVDFTAKSNVGGEKESYIEDYAVKAENEYHATDKFILTLGGRAEHFSEVDWVFNGRGSIIYKPTINQRLALTIANGYYLPSLAQLYGWGDVLPFPSNSSLKEERIGSYELAYYGNLAKHIKSNIAIFYNDYKGLIGTTLTNEVDGYKQGLELGLDFLHTHWLTSFLNYTYQTIHRTDFGDLAVDPKHMFNCGINAKFDRWSSNLTFHYVDKYYEIYDAANPVLGFLTPPQEVNAYTTVDVRIAYMLKDNLEFALSSTNLFNNVHYESNPVGFIGADEVSRRIALNVSYNF
ncbi:MAG: TonB-dependent receptor [Elusimicrobiota bacterium]